MAEVYGKMMAALNGTPPEYADASVLKGKVRVAQDEIEAAVAADDTVVLGVLPVGAVPLFTVMHFAAAQTAVMSLGIRGKTSGTLDPNALRDAGVASSAGTEFVTNGDITVNGTPLTEESEIVMTVATNPLTANVVRSAVYYSVE